MQRCLWLAVLLSACTWKAGERVANIVWSDDGEEVALVVERYEWREKQDMYGRGSDERRHRHQIYVQSLPNGPRTAFGPEFSGVATADLYYMRHGAKAPYILTSRLVGTNYVFELLRKNGEVVRLATSPALSTSDCSWADVIPSPDGELLARIVHPSACDDKAVVTFFDSTTLAQVGVSSAIPSTAARLTAAWQASGDFVVVALAPAAPAAFTVDIEGDVVAAAVPECLYPKTTSSAVSGDGEFITASNETVRVETIAPTARFGCE